MSHHVSGKAAPGGRYGARSDLDGGQGLRDENRQLKEVVAEATLQNRVLKSLTGPGDGESLGAGQGGTGLCVPGGGGTCPLLTAAVHLREVAFNDGLTRGRV